MQSVPITTKVTSSNPVHGEVYLIQHYVIKFVSDMRQVGEFFPGTTVSGIEIGKFKLVAQTRFLIKNVYMFN